MSQFSLVLSMAVMNNMITKYGVFSVFAENAIYGLLLSMPVSVILTFAAAMVIDLRVVRQLKRLEAGASFVPIPPQDHERRSIT